LFLDHSTKLLLDGEKKDRKKKSLTAIVPGNHVMHYDRSVSSRYYFEFESKQGINYIEPNFKDHQLPALSRHLTWSEDKNKNHLEAQREVVYFTYDGNNRKLENTARIWLSQTISKKSPEGEPLTFTFEWKVERNDTVISKDKIVEIHSSKIRKTLRKKLIIYTDTYHFFMVKYYIIRNSCDLEVRAGFSKYKDK